jgi:hypothetical protein
MKRLRGLLWPFALLSIAATTGCYSHTKEKEVVIEHGSAPPSSCKHAVWVPAAGGTAGYWSCT